MALYHKHRPQLWSSVIGQETAVTTLQNQIKTNTPAHAYLLSGARGVGKTTTARLIAKSLNCERRKAGESEPCSECSQCLDIARGAALDVIEIDAASHTGVDTVRETIIANAQFQPTSAKYKIFIIDEVHMLSTAAFNALLKTLEEPPERTVFILATTELHKLPATIISRCQRFIFKKIPRSLMNEHVAKIAQVEGVEIAPDVIARLTRASEGSARDAVSLLDQIMATSGKVITAETVDALLPSTGLELLLSISKIISTHNPEAGLAWASKAVASGLSPIQLLSDLIRFWRGLLLSHYTPELAATELDAGAEQQAEIKELLRTLSPTRLVQLIDLAQARYLESRQASIPELPLELLIITACTHEPQKTVLIHTPTTPVTTTPTATVKPVEKIITQNVEPVVENKSPESSPTVIQPTTTPEVRNTEPETVLTGPALSLDTAQVVWRKFVTSLESHSPSLVFLLKDARATAVTGNVLTVQVAYDFHKDKLTERTTKKKMEDELSKQAGTRVMLDVEVKKAEPDPAAAGLNDLAAAFGGEVI